jgi:hypothetical protein
MLQKMFNRLKFVSPGFIFFRPRENYASGTTILVVNNDFDLCRVICRYLENQGFKVLVAHEPSSAKVLSDMYGPSIILMGTEFSNFDQPAFKKNPVVLMTPKNTFNPDALSKMIYQALIF